MDLLPGLGYVFPKSTFVSKRYWYFLTNCSYNYLKGSGECVFHEKIGDNGGENVLWILNYFKIKFRDACMILRVLILKTKKLSDFLRWGSKLFYSIMADRKKKF